MFEWIAIVVAVVLLGLLFRYKNKYTAIVGAKSKRHVSAIVDRLRRDPDSQDGRGRTVLCILNPIGGQRLALPMFQQVVRPILQARGFVVEQRETTHARHAWQIARDLVGDPSKRDQYCAICVVGGDGLVYEVLNGLLEPNLHKGNVFSRKGTEGVDNTSSSNRIPLLIVPTGTGNGLHTAIAPEWRREKSLFKCERVALLNRIAPLDLMEVRCNATMDSNVQHASCGSLSLSYGIIADADYMSETKFRWAGPPFAPLLGAVTAIFRNQSYHARLTYEDENEEEVTESGVYSCILAANVAFLTYDMMISPKSQINDGFVHILIIKKVSRVALLRLFSGVEDGLHINDPNVRFIRTSRFRLEPLNTVGNIIVDGERIPYGPVSVRVLKSAAQVFVP